MPGLRHSLHEIELRKYFKSKFPNYNDESIFDKYGSWNLDLSENKKEINLNGRYPDLFISHKNYNFCYVGEAKQEDDFDKEGRLLPRSQNQLEDYIKWIKTNVNKYSEIKVIYSVPILFVPRTRMTNENNEKI